MNFANVLSSGLRIIDGQSASWTFEGIRESSIVLPALVQVIERNADGTIGVNVLGSFTPVQQVPEPGTIGVLLTAIGLMGIRAKRALKTK